MRRQSIREHSREMSFHDEIAGKAFSDRTDLPLKTTNPAIRLPQKNSQSPSTQSSGSRRAASLSRAITALSQFSSRSNLRALPLRSSTNYDKIGSTDDDPEGSSRPRSSWVQDFLGRSSAMPAASDLSTLTTRPSKAAAERRRVVKVPVKTGESCSRNASQGSHDENVHYDRTATTATDEQTFVRRRQEDVEIFSKTIYDLEMLLREALVIAHQAADTDDDNQALVHRRPSIRYLPHQRSLR